MKKATAYIKENLSVNTVDLGEDGLMNIAKTSMSSKLIGSESKFFSNLAVKCIMSVKNKHNKYPIKSINIIKAHGQSTLDSECFPGYVLRLSRASQQMPTRITNAKIACLDFNLNKFRLAMGI